MKQPSSVSLQPTTELDDDDGMTGVRRRPGELRQLEASAVEALGARAPAVVSALVECAGFMNRIR